MSFNIINIIYFYKYLAYLNIKKIKKLFTLKKHNSIFFLQNYYL
jgi:hypothetical protein